MVATQPNNINTIERIDLVQEEIGLCETVTNHYWWGNPILMYKLVTYLNNRNIDTNVIDIGCAQTPFMKATHIVDFSKETDKIERIEKSNKFNIDLDIDKIPVIDKFFNFVYCRHTIEDIANPQFAVNEMLRVSPRGFIETPSPLIECLKCVDGQNCDGINPQLNYCGYIHHRYIVWSNKSNNTIYFLPKYPIIEYLNHNDSFLKKITYIANKYPVYWNNYYLWDENNKPNIVVYRHGINFTVHGFHKLLLEGIQSSIEYTNHLLTII